MKAEILRQVSERLDAAKRDLMEARRIAKDDPEVSKHLVRSLIRMVGECDHEMARVAGMTA